MRKNEVKIGDRVTYGKKDVESIFDHLGGRLTDEMKGYIRSNAGASCQVAHMNDRAILLKVPNGGQPAEAFLDAEILRTFDQSPETRFIVVGPADVLRPTRADRLYPSRRRRGSPTNESSGVPRIKVGDRVRVRMDARTNSTGFNNAKSPLGEMGRVVYLFDSPSDPRCYLEMDDPEIGAPLSDIYYRSAASLFRGGRYVCAEIKDLEPAFPDASKMYPSRRRRPGTTNESTAPSVYKSKRHRLIKESVETPTFQIGDRVRICNKPHDKWLTGRPGEHEGSTGIVVLIYDRTLGDGRNCYVDMDDPKDGITANCFGKARELMDLGLGIDHRFIAVNEVDLELLIPDASKMYPSRRRKPGLNESVSLHEFRPGDQVKITSVQKGGRDNRCLYGFEERFVGMSGEVVKTIVHPFTENQYLMIFLGPENGTPPTELRGGEDVDLTRYPKVVLVWEPTVKPAIPDASKMYPTRRRLRPTNESAGRQFNIGDRVRVRDESHDRNSDIFCYDRRQLGMVGVVVDILVCSMGEGRQLYLDVGGVGVDPGDLSSGLHGVDARKHPRVIAVWEDTVESAVPVYKARRHRPLMESLSGSKFVVGDRVKIREKPRQGNLIGDPRYHVGATGTVVFVCLRTDFGHNCYVDMDNPLDGVRANEFGRAADLRALGLGPDHRFIAVFEDDLELAIPDASKMYPSRRRPKPLTESSSEYQPQIGDRVRTVRRISYFRILDLPENRFGTVVHVGGATISVRFDEPFPGGWSCNDKCESDRGRCFVIGSNDPLNGVNPCIEILPRTPVYKGRRHRRPPMKDI